MISETPHPNENNRIPLYLCSEPQEAVQQWGQQSDWSSTCCHCSDTASLLSSVCLCNRVWAGVDRARPCVGNRSPDTGPKVSCLCFLLSSGALSDSSHTTARLDICGQQIEMQVVIVTRMIDAFLPVSHELKGEKRYTVGCICTTFMHANTHTHIHCIWHTVKGSLCWWVHTECQSMQRGEGKGGLYI